MRNLSDTIARLSAMKRDVAVSLNSPRNVLGQNDRLHDLGPIDANPGGLSGKYYLPGSGPAKPALVVILHGCTQEPDTFDVHSGWSRLGEEQGFAVLYPQQSRANNPNLCFNWFAPDDIARGTGECASIIRMIDEMILNHGIDPDRVFITGLSAGGAMALAALASYPERFAAGAVIAGIPFGIASSIPEAFDRMRGHGIPDAATLGRLVRSASEKPRSTWPRLSVWHGAADQTVDPVNADAIVAQWNQLHAASEQPPGRTSGRVRTRRWNDSDGRTVIESHLVSAMGHGMPLAVNGSAKCGSPGPFMIDVEVPATRAIAGFWGIAPTEHAEITDEHVAPGAHYSRADSRAPLDVTGGGLVDNIGRVINDALRSAGLLRP